MLSRIAGGLLRLVVRFRPEAVPFLFMWANLRSRLSKNTRRSWCGSLQ